MPVLAMCKIKAAGPSEDGHINIRLAELPGTDYFRGGHFWFQADSAREREMLATALAAMSADRSVSVSLSGVDLNAEPGGNIAGKMQTIYMMV